MAVITEVAQAVVDTLNAAAPSLIEGGFTAARGARPQYDLAQLKHLRVTVVPKGIEIAVGSRSGHPHDYQIDVAVQQRVSKASEEADIDRLLTLVEAIGDLFRGRRLALVAGREAVWVKTEHQPVYAPEHLEQFGVFTSVLTFTFRVWR